MNRWRIEHIPPQQGRLAVITGATGGLGQETALALAGAGAQVVLTGRDQARGEAALERIRAVHPAVCISYETLDLGSLASIRDFAGRFARLYPSLDILVNNGAVMAPPVRHQTVDGFELQFGTNYLGHFALTARLLPLLMRGQSARVVNVSSIAHRHHPSLRFDDLNSQRRYKAFEAYAHSKLALLMFTFELQRRSDAGGWGVTGVAAHPGLVSTALFSNGQRLGGNRRPAWVEAIGDWMIGHVALTPPEGALAILYAATSPDASGAGYYGPTRFVETRGELGCAAVAPYARDQTAAARLWQVSEVMTGVHLAPGQENPCQPLAQPLVDADESIRI